MSLIPGNNGRIEDILKISPKDQKKKIMYRSWIYHQILKFIY